MPGPPLRGTLSPPATSITKICTSTSARLNVAVRLSPPLSTQHEVGREALLEASTASTFSLMSSRMAVCGQQPVSHPDDALGVEHGLALEDGGVLGGEDVVGHDDDRELVGEGPAQAGDQLGLAARRRGRRCRRAGRRPWPGRGRWSWSGPWCAPMGCSCSGGQTVAKRWTGVGQVAKRRRSQPAVVDGGDLDEGPGAGREVVERTGRTRSHRVGHDRSAGLAEADGERRRPRTGRGRAAARAAWAGVVTAWWTER